MSLKVRRATELDAGQLVRLLRDAHSEYEGFPVPHLPSLFQWVGMVLVQGIAYVVHEEGYIVGSLGLIQTFCPWNQLVPLLRCEWLYVHPDHRKGGAAQSLLDSAEGFSATQKTAIIMGINNPHQPELKDIFLKRRGYIYCGGNFIRAGGEE